MHRARKLEPLPDNNGYFGQYGGQFVPEPLQNILDEITTAYNHFKDSPGFKKELSDLRKHYVGRPSPIYHCRSLSSKLGGGQIYLKREDLNHTGAHKINHCLGEALLAKRMGKKKIIAETGAGQHGVALATAAALAGLECDIYMGEVDMEKEHPNVVRMKILGTNVIPVGMGLRTLKEAVDAAFEGYMKDPINQFYAIGSVVGPHPFPMMVRDFQRVVGEEAREQILELTGRLPDYLVACVGGGSNAIGLFSAFLDDAAVRMYGVEPSGKGFKTGNHAATLTLGKPGVIHGFKCYVLQDAEGRPLPVYSIASGLDYPGVGPEHSYLKDIKRVEYRTISDSEALDAFFELSRVEGIIPALESAHAVAYAMKMARRMDNHETILVNCSGRGDKDIDYVAAKYGHQYGIN
ncbi:MAG: tryptophan synthase subunit beta [Candidatus Zixiibacteriota bacterium]|nr:MAG: tryptophan synthase subunit beta [candidate division Zixibacteria bacterium]